MRGERVRIRIFGRECLRGLETPILDIGYGEERHVPWTYYLMRG